MLPNILSRTRTRIPAALILAATLASPALAVGPWASNPVVFGQEVGGVVDADYNAAWTHWKDLGYAPVNLSGVEKSGSATRYSGLWHKNPSIVSWTSKRGLTAAAYQTLWDQLIGQGYRVLDLDAHVVSGQALYDAIWIKEQGGSKAFKSHRILTLAQLDAKIAEYGGQRFRPIRINGYRVGNQSFYAAVWVQDGLTDAPIKRDLTSAQYASWWTFYKDNGYHPVDIAAYVKGGTLLYAGIWVREAGIDNWISLRDRTATQMQAEIIAQKKANYLEIDIDAYYTTGGSLRFSGVWIRRQARNVLTGNVVLSGTQIDQLKAKLTEYTTNGTDGRKGAFGFYIEDLTTGHWIAFNPNEPFYLASAAKTFIAAKAVSMPEISAGDLYQLRTSDWRGEATRGFTKADIGDNQTIATYLDHMINNSDSCSTDRLSGLITGFDGALAVNKFLDSQAEMQNVGEITSICTVDKRIQGNAHSCAFSVPCNSFESWFRSNDLSYSSAADIACFNNINGSGVSNNTRYDLYYNTLANSVTPAEAGRFFRSVADHDLLTVFDEGDLVRELDKNNSYAPPAAGAFQAWGGKDGGKYKVKSWIGLAWNWDFGSGDYSSLTHQFSVAMFTEDWTTDDATGDSKATAIIGDAIKAAIPYLVSKR
ncbi:MAG TPA: serine hydrolase [Thermoanaerobaculia bacterium]|jgi:hypothetical protein|nr:serine hydrolase [Thermoanaerobaculia bacterium]